MSDATFYTPVRKELLWATLVFCAVGSALQIYGFARFGSLSSLVFALLGACLAVWAARGLWSHRRPVLDVSQAAIEHGALGAISPTRIASEDIEAVVESKPRGVVLQTRSGRRVTIRLRYVRKREREAARQAIEHWVAEHAGREA